MVHLCTLVNQSAYTRCGAIYSDVIDSAYGHDNTLTQRKKKHFCLTLIVTDLNYHSANAAQHHARQAPEDLQCVENVCE